MDETAVVRRALQCAPLAESRADLALGAVAEYRPGWRALTFRAFTAHVRRLASGWVSEPEIRDALRALGGRIASVRWRDFRGRVWMVPFKARP
jgi:hypothetical protein